MMNKLMTFFAVIAVTSSVFAETSIYNCSQDLERAKQMVQADGTVENESIFLFSTAVAVDACSELAKERNFKGLESSIKSMRTKCDASANQGQSELYHGTCYLKLAELAKFILGN